MKFDFDRAVTQAELDLTVMSGPGQTRHKSGSHP